MQKYRFLGPNFNWVGQVGRGKSSPRYGQSAHFSIQTRDHIIDVAEAVLRHKSLDRLERSERHDLKGEDSFTNSILLFVVGALGAKHAWRARLNNNSGGLLGKLKDTEHSEAS